MPGPFDVDSSTKKGVRKVANAAIAKAIEEFEGNVSAAARKLKMRRGAVRDRIDASSDLTLTLQEHREGVIDDAETNIFKAARSGDIPACKFVLSTIGKDRGYGTRQEITGANGAPITAEVTYHMVKTSIIGAPLG